MKETKEELIIKNEKLEAENLALHQQFISFELAERSFLIGQRQIGSKEKFISIATCRNRSQTETLVRLLNKEHKDDDSFQARVKPWMLACFGEKISQDKIERNHRFIEEALELVQANGTTKEEALQLVEYVYGRPQGIVPQEVGGVMVTLAALCLTAGINMHKCAETELTRIWGKIEQIRSKQAAKPKHSPLPK